MSFRNYILWEGEKIITSVVVAGLTYYLQSLVRMENLFLEFILKMVVVTILANGILVLRYYRTEEFGYIKGIVTSVLDKLKSAKKH